VKTHTRYCACRGVSRKSRGEKHISLSNGSAVRSRKIKRRVYPARSKHRPPYGRSSSGGVPGHSFRRINIVLPGSRGASTPLRSRSSPAHCDSARRNLCLAPYAAAWNPPLRPTHRVAAIAFRPSPCVVPPVCPTAGVPQGAHFVRERGALACAGIGPASSATQGGIGGVAAGGGAPHSRTNNTPWGTPAVGRTGGTVRPERSRAGSSHGEPRTEPRPPRRRSRVSDTSRALAGGIFSLIP
jgi:hypothetical protein